MGGKDKDGGTQDPGERREIRHQYRNLLQEADDKKEQLSNYKNVDQLQELMHRGNEVYKRVNHTREAALDSQFMVGISQLTVAGARELPSNFVNFLPVEFAEKLVTFIGGYSEGGENDIDADGWLKLGQGCVKCFKRSPPLKFLFGSFERDPPKKKEKKERRSAQIDKDSKEVTKPRQVESTSELGRKEATTEEVDYINQTLRNVYKLTHRKPVCYFEFVTDPSSFGHTIENMFYVSFLVKDGHCRIFLDNDRLPVIEPIERNENEQPQGERKQQVIMSLTPQQWKEIIDRYGITKAVIKRKYTPTPSHHPPHPPASQSMGVEDSDDSDSPPPGPSSGGPPPKKTKKSKK